MTDLQQAIRNLEVLERSFGDDDEDNEKVDRALAMLDKVARGQGQPA